MSKLNNIKAIFLDIDGTLTNSKKQVPEYNAQVIKEAVEKGIKVVLCSGRCNEYVEIKSKAANASSQIISSNGAQIYDYNLNKSLFELPIDEEILKKLIEKLNNSQMGFILNCTDIRFSNAYLKRSLDENDRFFENWDSLEDRKVFQIVVETRTYDAMDEIVKYIKEIPELNILNYSVTYLKGNRDCDRYYIDVDAAGANKGNAIKEYLKINNIKIEDAICFGDHVNDYDMFKVCGYGVAMGNANAKLKQMANFVTLTNDENGVGVFIKENIL